MNTRQAAPKIAQLRGASLATLVIGAWCGPVLGSSGFDVHCSETIEQLPVAAVAAPQLSIQVADNGLAGNDATEDAALTTPIHTASSPSPQLSPVRESVLGSIFAERDETIRVAPSSEPVNSPAVADANRSTVDKTSENDEGANDANRNDMPASSTRLPGATDADQPRFRRQMNRTDI